MHPSYSVIFFTTSSGAGYGLLILLGLLAPWDATPADRSFGLAANVLALGLITFGLLASTAHLGRPERAWRALSQWRTSWLSREGVLALATYVPAALFAALWVFGERISPLFGFLSAVGAVATVACTAMIYRSLKPVQRWCNGFVVPVYLALSAMSGALWLFALVALWDAPVPWLFRLTAASVVIAAALKLGYWRFIDRTRSISTAETATGLGRFGKVSLLDPPHTEDNYLLKEMGYRIARKHAVKLRWIAFLAGFAVPLALLFLSLAVPVAALAAAFFGMLGTLVERWLFFAEAKHTVTLYYGAATA